MSGGLGRPMSARVTAAPGASPVADGHGHGHAPGASPVAARPQSARGVSARPQSARGHANGHGHGHGGSQGGWAIGSATTRPQSARGGGAGGLKASILGVVGVDKGGYVDSHNIPYVYAREGDAALAHAPAAGRPLAPARLPAHCLPSGQARPGSAVRAGSPGRTPVRPCSAAASGSATPRRAYLAAQIREQALVSAGGAA